MIKHFIILIVCAFSCIGGCSIRSLNPFSLRPAEKKTYHRKRMKRRVPVVVNYTKRGGGFKPIIAYRSESYEEIDSEKTTPKQTFMQKIGSWIGGLGIGLGLLIFVCPPIGIPILYWIIRKFRDAKSALRETVLAVREAGNVDNNLELHGALLKYQSKRTRALVDKERNRL